MSEPSHVTDAVLARLRLVLDQPELAGTRYELREPLGRGGMGVVWRAHDTVLARDVALKVLAAGIPEADERLFAEAKVLATLEHPGIVPVHDVGRLGDGRSYYAMKLVRGRNLDQLAVLELAPTERLRVFTRICEAVAFAHARGVVHRDLKPGNVMVGEFGEVLVLDWGLAKVAGENEARRVGTPGFMAPEQEAGAGDVDAQADVFALGRLLATLGLEGRAVAAVVAKATAASREDRYADARELAHEAESAFRGEAVRAVPETAWTRLARWYRRSKVAVWLVVSYAVLRIAFELARSAFGGR